MRSVTLSQIDRFLRQFRYLNGSLKDQTGHISLEKVRKLKICLRIVKKEYNNHFEKCISIRKGQIRALKEFVARENYLNTMELRIRRLLNMPT